MASGDDVVALVGWCEVCSEGALDSGEKCPVCGSGLTLVVPIMRKYVGKMGSLEKDEDEPGAGEVVWHSDPMLPPATETSGLIRSLETIYPDGYVAVIRSSRL